MDKQRNTQYGTAPVQQNLYLPNYSERYERVENESSKNQLVYVGCNAHRKKNRGKRTVLIGLGALLLIVGIAMLIYMRNAIPQTAKVVERANKAIGDTESLQIEGTWHGTQSENLSLIVQEDRYQFIFGNINETGVCKRDGSTFVFVSDHEPSGIVLIDVDSNRILLQYDDRVLQMKHVDKNDFMFAF